MLTFVVSAFAAVTFACDNNDAAADDDAYLSALGPHNFNDEAVGCIFNSVVAVNDGFVAVGSYYDGSDNLGIIVLFNSDLSVEMRRATYDYDSNGDCCFTSVVATSDGKFAAVGYAWSPDHTYEVGIIVLFEYDSTDSFIGLFENSLPDKVTPPGGEISIYSRLYSVIALNGGGFVAVGEVSDENKPSRNNGLIVKFGSNLLNTFTLGVDVFVHESSGSVNDYCVSFYSVAATDDGFVVVGDVSGQESGANFEHGIIATYDSNFGNEVYEHFTHSDQGRYLDETWFRSVVYAGDDEFVVAGWAFAENSDKGFIAVFKPYDTPVGKSFEVLKYDIFGEVESSHFYSVVDAGDNVFIAAGDANSSLGLVVTYGEYSKAGYGVFDDYQYPNQFYSVVAIDGGGSAAVGYAEDETNMRGLIVRSSLQTIDIAAILGVTPPVTGAAPVTAITPTDQYTGEVHWNPTPASDGTKFGPSTSYTAKIIITPKAGYTLNGVAANFFTVAGTSSPATNAADSGEITAVFPATGEAPPSTPGFFNANVMMVIGAVGIIAVGAATWFFFIRKP